MSSNFDEILKIQRLAADRLMQETQVDSKINFLDLIRKIASNKKLQVEQLILVAQEEGYQEVEILNLLEELERDDYLYSPEPGYIKLRV